MKMIFKYELLPNDRDMVHHMIPEGAMLLDLQVQTAFP